MRGSEDLPTPSGGYEIDGPPPQGVDRLGESPRRAGDILPPAPVARFDSIPTRDDDEPEDDDGGLTPQWSSRPLMFLAMFALVVAVVAWGVHQVVRRGLADQFKRGYQDVSLLPANPLKITPPDEQLQVYYIARGLALVPYRLKLQRPAGPQERLSLVMRALEKAPRGGLMESPLPKGCQVRGVYLLENVAWIDLSPEFLKPARATPHLERLTIYSIVNSIKLNAPAIQGVRFMVAGQPVDSGWGWLDLSSPLGADLSMIQ